MKKEGTRILVVDASLLARTIIADNLKKEFKGAQITAVATGQEAKAILEDPDNHFDLVTTSLYLTDLDGLALCRILRSNKQHSHTPIIVVSSDADDRLEKEGFAAGITEYFNKSKGTEALIEFIKSFVRRNPGFVGRVLFVEDSPTAAMVSIKMMEKHGLDIYHVQSAEEAINVLKESSNEQRFDLVITDFYLKGYLTGGDLLYQIRAKLHYAFHELPVLVITGSSAEKQVEAFHAGANDYIEKPLIEEILIARIRSLLMVKHSFDALQRQTEELRLMSITDSLTGVNNKRYLLDNGEHFLHSQNHQHVAVVILDIDHFKKVNDTYGHLDGDRVLESIGRYLGGRLCKDGHIISRFGGEEFTALICNTNYHDIKILTESIRTDIEAMKPANIPITFSIGIALNNEHPNRNLSQLLESADKALYAAKENGRNRVYISRHNDQLELVTENPMPVN